MTLAQANALALVTGRSISLREPVRRQVTITDRRTAEVAARAYEPEPEDSADFRAFARLQRQDRYGR